MENFFNPHMTLLSEMILKTQNSKSDIDSAQFFEIDRQAKEKNPFSVRQRGLAYFTFKGLLPFRNLCIALGVRPASTA